MIPKCIARCVVVTLLSVSSANAASVVIYGASGNLGSKITTEALNRGHDVIGVGRDPSSMTFDHDNFTAAGRLGEEAPRVIQMGGGYTLYLGGELLVDTLGLELGHPRYGIYHGHIAAIEHYRASDVEWTVISPPPGPALQPGERTGIFRVGEDEVVLGDDGEASISQEDLAVLFINEAEVPRAIGKRITIGY
jgi:putative NADH-flavin reductase